MSTYSALSIIPPRKPNSQYPFPNVAGATSRSCRSSFRYKLKYRQFMSLPTIFSGSRPRADVESCGSRADEFTADLSRLVNGPTSVGYFDPIGFFALSCPTRGTCALHKAVCLRLCGKGGEVSSISRLGTQYGGGRGQSVVIR